MLVHLRFHPPLNGGAPKLLSVSAGAGAGAGEAFRSLTKLSGNSPRIPFTVPSHHPSSTCDCVEEEGGVKGRGGGRGRRREGEEEEGGVKGRGGGGRLRGGRGRGRREGGGKGEEEGGGGGGRGGGVRGREGRGEGRGRRREGNSLQLYSRL